MKIDFKIKGVKSSKIQLLSVFIVHFENVFLPKDCVLFTAIFLKQNLRLFIVLGVTGRFEILF